MKTVTRVVTVPTTSPTTTEHITVHTSNGGSSSKTIHVPEQVETSTHTVDGKVTTVTYVIPLTSNASSVPTSSRKHTATVVVTNSSHEHVTEVITVPTSIHTTEIVTTYINSRGSRVTTTIHAPTATSKPVHVTEVVNGSTHVVTTYIPVDILTTEERITVTDASGSHVTTVISVPTKKSTVVVTSYIETVDGKTKTMYKDTMIPITQPTKVVDVTTRNSNGSVVTKQIHEADTTSRVVTEYTTVCSVRTRHETIPNTMKTV